MTNPFLKVIDDRVAAEEQTQGAASNPFLPLIDNKQKVDSADFNAAMNSARDTDPDAYAKQAALAKRTGIPVEIVERNAETVEKQAPFLSGEYDVLQQTHPKTAAFLSKDDNAKFAKDDIPQLAAAEQIAKMNDTFDYGRAFWAGVNRANVSLAQLPGVALNMLRATGAAAYLSDELVRKAYENPVAQFYQRAAEYYTDEEINQSPMEAITQGDFGKAARLIAAQVVTNLPQQVVVLGSLMAGQPAVGLGFGGLISGSEASKESFDEGKSPIMSTLDGILRGSAEVIGERYGTMGIFKHWETALIKSYGKATAKKVLADAGKVLASSILGEGAEEYVTEWGQALSDYITGDVNAFNRIGTRSLDALLIGGASGGAISSPTVFASAAFKSYKASQDAKFWDEFSNVTGKSKLRERSPEKYEAFVNEVLAENNKPQNIYLSYEALSQFFQSEGKADEVELNKFLDEMQIKDQLAEAMAGREFEISAAKFMTRYAGSPLSQALRPDMRFSSDGMTDREKAQLQQEYAKMVLEMQQERAELFESQTLPPELQAMRDKLVLPKDVGGAGMAAEDADAALSIWLAQGRVYAKKRGVTLEEYVRQVNPVLNVGGVAINAPDILNQAVQLEDSENFKRYFEGSKVVNAEGRPLQVYHGTKRPDRVGTRFLKSRAVSGPAAYFTDDAEIASNYAKGKNDTSLVNEDVWTYEHWFRMKLSGFKKAVDLDRAWYFLPQETKQLILERAPKIASNDNGDIVWDETATRGNGGYDIQYHRGNGLKALIDAWLNSGALFNDEREFTKILKMAGVDIKQVEFHDPNAEFPAVIPVYLAIKNPLNTSQIPQEVVKELENVANRKRVRPREHGADPWDKNIRDAKQWIAQLKEDMTNEVNSYVWTSVPDWVVDTLKRLGYDGIQDVGGKGGGQSHTVWIPFDSKQIKSSVGNKGTFNPNSPNILLQTDPAVKQQNELGFYSKLIQVMEEKMPNSAPAQQIEGILAGSGVKREEIEWMGVKEFLAGKTKVSKEDLIQFLRGNQLQIKEVTLGYTPKTELAKAQKQEAVRDTEEIRRRIQRKAEELQDQAFREASDEWYSDYYNDYIPPKSGVEELDIDSEELDLTDEEREAYKQRLLRADTEQADLFGEIRKPVPAPGWKATFDGEDLGVFKTEAEANSAYQDAYDEYYQALQDSDYDEFRRDWYNEHDLESYEEQAREELGLEDDESRDESDPVNLRPKFKNYILDNGTNYREVLLTLPDPGQAEYNKLVASGVPLLEAQNTVRDKTPTFTSSHFSQKNILAHFRLTERETPLGRTLFIEEIQSDWHQQGRERGYAQKVDTSKWTYQQTGGLIEVFDENGTFMASAYTNSFEEARAYAVKQINSRRLPDAPFKKTWHELASKRILRMAVEEGYDALAWTTGEQQVERYESALRSAVDVIRWTKTEQGVQLIGYKKSRYITPSGNDVPGAPESFDEVVNTTEKETALSDAIGKAMAEKILSSPEQTGEIQGEGIKIGDTGMAGFYDRIIPQFLSKYTKPWKGVVGTTEIDTKGVIEKPADEQGRKFLTQGDIKAKVHSLKITPEMKESIITQGQPLFQGDGSPRGSVQFTDTATLINLYKSANLSTFLHESGHVFMREMQKLIEAGAADPQTVLDYQALIKFVGGDINTREAQEKLARAFEAYLREGRAPSVKLMDAFNRFREWLTAIYRSIRGLNVEITEEVRDVFDRILASESELEEAKQFYRAKKSLLDLMPVTPEQKSRIQKAKELSDEEALSKAVKARLSIYLRLQGGKQEIREQARKEINALPVYSAIMNAITSGGMDLELFKGLYGKEAADKIRANHPNVLRQKEKAKKKRSYHAEVISRGGINPDSMGEQERKYFKEHGLIGVFRKPGWSLDEIAQELESEGLLQVPDDKHPGDYLKEMLESKANLPDFDPFVPENSITLEELAAEHGFQSPDDLAQQMIKAERRSKAISARAREILLQKEQDLLKDLKAAEQVPGEEALHNEKSLTYLIVEAEILAQKIAAAKNRRPDVIEEKLYRAVAAEVIGDKKVREAVRYDLYARAEQRYSKQAEEALLQGDFEKALVAKKRQLTHHAMVIEAIKARDEKAKIEKFFSAKNYKAKLANTENEFAEAAMDLTSTYKLGTGSFVPTVENALDKIADMDEFLIQSLPDWIRRKQLTPNFKDYRDLTMNKFRELNDAIRAVLQYGSNLLASNEKGETKTVQEKVKELSEKMEQLPDRASLDPKKNKRDDSHRLVGPWLRGLDSFESGSTLMQMLSDWMDNFSFLKTGNMGPLKELYNRVLKAEIQYTDLKEEVVKDSKKAWELLGKAAQRLAEKHGTHINIPDVPMPEDMKRTHRGLWNADRMIAFLLNTGNAGNLTALKAGLGFTDQQIQKIASYFTAEELRAIQAIWKSTDLLFPRLDETHFTIYNRHLPKVAPQPITFTSADGQQVELEGGYYPLVFDPRVSDRAAQYHEDDVMKNHTKAIIRSSKPEDGMTHARIGGRLPPLLETHVWFTHINRTARYISHARILRDLNRITRDKDYAKLFKKKAGDDHYKAMRDWLQFNANPAAKMLHTPADRWLEALRHTSTAVILGFKTAVGLKQRVAVISAAQAMGRDDIARGWGWILRAYKETDFRVAGLGLSQSKTWQDILKRSSYLRIRDGNIDREISDMRRGLDPQQKKFKIGNKEFTGRDIQDFAFEWIKMNDRAVVSVVWTAAYNQYVHEKAAKGATPEQIRVAAADYADQIVQDTQASSISAELSEMQRAEGWRRLFTMFMTSAVNYGNRVMQNYRAWNTGAITNREFFNHVLQEYIAMPYAAYIISIALRSGDDEPEWWQFLLVPFEALASFIPVIRDAFSFWSYGSDIGISAVFEPIKRVARAAKSTAQWGLGEGEFTQALWDVGRVIEAYYKTPALNFVKDIKSVYEKLTE